jgi:type IV pilus assembly protein PilP
MTLSRIGCAALVFALLTGLAGCGDGGVQEVRQWMDEVRRQTKISIPPLMEPKKFTPFTYGGKDNVDPYNPSKLAVAFAKLQANSPNALKPDLDRRREPLEAFPLDMVKMVGTLQKKGKSYGLLQVDKTVFQIRVGNYVGQNLGMITKITDTEVELKEIVQDASGDWVERKAKLELQETKK